MREIKFRCWNAFANTMQSWDDMVKLNKIHLLAKPKPSYPIMQYTGLKDKNGTEIYEGDIVETSFYSTKHRDTVEYTEIGFTPMHEPVDYDEVYAYPENWEVLGNIHENPDLLNEE